MAMYTARSLLGWSLEEFWSATPILLDRQMKCHIRAHRPRKKGMREQKKAPIPIKYVDQLPGQFW